MASLLTIDVRKRGFFTKEQQPVSIFFISFLVLCGVSCSAFFLTFFYPLYWILGGILLITGVSASMTAMLYLKNHKKLSAIPTRKEVDSLRKENLLLKSSSDMLTEHLHVWAENVSQQIQLLKSKHKRLSEELNKAEADTLTEHTTSDDRRLKVLTALEKIKRELKSVVDLVK